MTPMFPCPYCDNPDINHDWRDGGPESLDKHGEAYCRDNPEDCEPIASGDHPFLPEKLRAVK